MSTRSALSLVLLLGSFASATNAWIGGEHPGDLPWQAADAPVVARLTASELEQRGDALRSQKDLVPALELYQKASAKAPKNAVLWNKIGMVQLQLTKYEAARMAFERAIRLDKNYAEAINNAGVIHYRASDFKRAAKYYSRALKIRDSASFHSNLGAAYFEQKKLPEALAEYRRAMELDPEVFERTSASGIALRVSRPEDRANFAFMLARLYAKSGDVDHALTQLRRAIENGYKNMDPVMKEEDFAQLRQDPRFAELMKLDLPAIPE